MFILLYYMHIHFFLDKILKITIYQLQTFITFLI